MVKPNKEWVKQRLERAIFWKKDQERQLTGISNMEWIYFNSNKALYKSELAELAEDRKRVESELNKLNTEIRLLNDTLILLPKNNKWKIGIK